VRKHASQAAELLDRVSAQIKYQSSSECSIENAPVHSDIFANPELHRVHYCRSSAAGL